MEHYLLSLDHVRVQCRDNFTDCYQNFYFVHCIADYIPITDIPITVTLGTPIKNIGIEYKDTAPTTLCDNQVTLETELTALKSFFLE